VNEDLGFDARPPKRGRWIVAIVIVLMLAFATVGGLQWRQFSLLNGTVLYEGDNIVWSFFQLESEYLKLRNVLRDTLREPERLEREVLQTRYDIFVSRIPLVESRRTSRLMDVKPIQTDTIARVRDFVTVADVYLGPTPARALDAEATRALLARLEPLGEPIHDMAMWANDTMAEQVGTRNDAVRQQSQISIALTLFQSLLTIAFALIVVRQLRALEQRGASLERLATRLQEARRDAEAAARSKSAFLANMSHELRTPFQGVLGMLALLEDSPLSAQQAEHLATARDSARHLLSLLNDVLDLSTLENGQLRLVTEVIDLRRHVADVERLMAVQARSKGLVLTVDVAASVPDHVEADPTRLRQVLFNLLGNALKFTDAGEVALHVDVDGGSAETPVLRFVVSDTGIGMDEATLARLFQRFAQGDESLSRRHGGTGLGLEISRNLARLMGGDIDVISRPGSGSRFTLRVPLPRASRPEAITAPAPAAPLAVPPLRVLVADDHPVNRRFLEELLVRQGHRVTLAEHGQAAVDAASRDAFDLVLMDLHMPVMNGADAAHRIRELPAPRGAVPIVALTADAFPEVRELALGSGMNDFLCKPVHPTELLDLLQRLFTRGPAPPERPRPAAGNPTADWLDRSVPGKLFAVMPEGLHRSMLDSFFADTAGSWAALIRHLDAESPGRDVREAAHAVKGVALNLGLVRLAQLASDLELAPDAPAGSDRRVRRDALQATLEGSRRACVEAGWIGQG
jgi:two-component system, sensor histidine kinase